MRTLWLLSPLALSVAAVAQTAIVLPSAAATAKPTVAVSNATSFYSTTSTSVLPDSHTQTIYDATDIAPATAVWSSLAVRRPHGVTSTNPACTAMATIVLSVGPNDSSTASTTFSANFGVITTTVLSGQISLSSQPNPAAWPAPWELPFPFTTPFPWVKSLGKSLVVDIHQTANSGGAPWLLEATGVSGGARVDNPSAQSTCKFSNGQFTSSISYVFPALGATWFVHYGNVPANLPGLGAIGARGAGGLWNGLTLPISLASLGAPGCSWSVSADLTVPLVASATGGARWPTLNIPYDTALIGASYYDHAAFIDPGANAWGVVTTWSSKWTISPGGGAPGTTLAATGNSASSPTGTLTAGVLATMQLN